MTNYEFGAKDQEQSTRDWQRWVFNMNADRANADEFMKDFIQKTEMNLDSSGLYAIAISLLFVAKAIRGMAQKPNGEATD